MEIIKMYGPALSGPARLVNRDVPACDEQAYVRVGYRRGTISDVQPDPQPETKAVKQRKGVSK